MNSRTETDSAAVGKQLSISRLRLVLLAAVSGSRSSELFGGFRTTPASRALVYDSLLCLATSFCCSK